MKVARVRVFNAALLAIAVGMPVTASGQTRASFNPGVPFEAGGEVSPDDGGGESGLSRGVRYRIDYSGGSAEVSGAPGQSAIDLLASPQTWSIQCLKDPIDDGRACTAQRGKLTIMHTSKYGWAVLFGDDAQRWSRAALRVDRRPPFYVRATKLAVLSGRAGAEAVAQLRSGTSVAMRYVADDDGSEVDEFQELFGADAAARMLLWGIKAIR